MADRTMSDDLDDRLRSQLAATATDGPWRTHGRHVFAPGHTAKVLHVDDDRADVVAQLPRLHQLLTTAEAERDAALRDLRELTEAVPPELVEVWSESIRARMLHGDQLDLLLVDPRAEYDPAGFYGMPTEAAARASLRTAVAEDRVTWVHVLVEEVAEALCATSLEDFRAELVQVSATALRMVRALDHQLAIDGATTVPSPDLEV